MRASTGPRRSITRRDSRWIERPEPPGKRIQWKFNAGGGNRTHTNLSVHGILNPARLQPN